MTENETTSEISEPDKNHLVQAIEFSNKGATTAVNRIMAESETTPESEEPDEFSKVVYNFSNNGVSEDRQKQKTRSNIGVEVRKRGQKWLPKKIQNKSEK